MVFVLEAMLERLQGQRIAFRGMSRGCLEVSCEQRPMQALHFPAKLLSAW